MPRPSIRAIVLAGGEGTRLNALTERLYGAPVPKQFMTLAGSRSLLQQTLDRIAPLVEPSRTIVVVPAAHVDLARTQVADSGRVTLLPQPSNRGTGPGILLPVGLIRALDPTAIVAIFPSDHHIRRPELVLRAVDRLATAAASDRFDLGLVGITPEREEPDLGWIRPGAEVGNGIQSVTGFVEKPPAMLARQLHQEATAKECARVGKGKVSTAPLWNSFIMVGKVRALWALGCRHLSAQARLLDLYFHHFGRSPETTPLLESIYAHLTPGDWSREVLARASSLAVDRVTGSGFGDCGTPERLFASLEGTPALDELRRRLDEAPRRHPLEPVAVEAR